MENNPQQEMEIIFSKNVPNFRPDCRKIAFLLTTFALLAAKCDFAYHGKAIDVLYKKII